MCDVYLSSWYMTEADIYHARWPPSTIMLKLNHKQLHCSVNNDNLLRSSAKSRGIAGKEQRNSPKFVRIPKSAKWVLGSPFLFKGGLIVQESFGHPTYFVEKVEFTCSSNSSIWRCVLSVYVSRTDSVNANVLGTKFASHGSRQLNNSGFAGVVCRPMHPLTKESVFYELDNERRLRTKLVILPLMLAVMIMLPGIPRLAIWRPAACAVYRTPLILTSRSYI